jgi:hypothetical protein
MKKQLLWRSQQLGSPSAWDLSNQDPSSQSATIGFRSQFQPPLAQSLPYGGQPSSRPSWEQQPPAPSVPRRSRGRHWIVLGIIALVLFAGGGVAVFASQALPHTWTTIQTFGGSGNQKTLTFTVPSDWKIVGTCQGFNDGSGINRSLVVSVYSSTGDVVNRSAVDTTCKAGSKLTTTSAEEHFSGSVYLEVIATGAWTIQVQEVS